MRNGYPAEKVANAFWHLAMEDNKAIDPMKVQKLVYLAHGLHLAVTNGIPLINENVEAWKYGPVFPSLYNKTKKYGSNPINSPIRSQIALDESDQDSALSDEAKSVLREVWRAHKTYDAITLSALTHDRNAPEGIPWYTIWDENGGDVGFGKVIPNGLIQENFNQILVEE